MTAKRRETPREAAARRRRYARPDPEPKEVERAVPRSNTMANVLLVGEAPGPASDPHEPLDPTRAGGAANRLAATLGMDAATFVRSFDRVNVFDTLEARRAHRRYRPWPMLRRPLDMYDFVIGLGRTAAARIDLPTGYTWCTWHEFDHGYRGAIPHPSGLNRWYNDEGCRGLVAAFVREAL